MSTYRNDGTEYHGSVFQKVNRDLEAGVLLSWTTGTQDTRYAVAAKYCVDEDATLRVGRILFSCH